jgi:hypothetical protein
MRLHSDKHNPPTITMAGSVLKFSDELTFLGVILNSRNNFLNHIGHIRKKASAKLMTCLRIAGRTWGIGREIRLMLYKTVFLSTILYASPAWISCLESPRSTEAVTRHPAPDTRLADVIVSNMLKCIPPCACGRDPH